MLREIANIVMYAGMALSMIGGARWPGPSWGVVAAGLALIGVGIGIRRAAGAPSLDEHAPDAAGKPARTGTLTDALTLVQQGVDELAAAAATMPLDDVKKRVEELNWLGVERLGAAQEVIIARVGFATYAEVMAPLATAERWLHRAWSAAADGHRPECLASLQTARGFAAEAAQLGLEKLAAVR
jgi:hypothetical protein